ncbi:MAG: rbsB 1 [Solirubrobacterales bacterium]|jgi:ribose transport system substrate-binding protein|nr:rbsB 1 [Solirubrobacterales bacterium]
MLRRRTSLAIPLLLVALLVGCGGEDKGSSGSTGASATAAGGAGDTKAAAVSSECSGPNVIGEADWNQGAKQLPAVPKGSVDGKRIAYIGFGQDNSWSGGGGGLGTFTGITCEAQANGAQAKFIGPPSFDAQVQFQLVSDLAVSKNYDGLVITPNDSTSIAPAIKQLVAAGIPVVSTLQPAGPDVLSMKNQVEGMTGDVIEDLTVNAETMAEGVIEACKPHDPCKVIVIWGVRALAFDKVKPDIFNKMIKSHPNIEIVCEGDGGYDQDVGKTAAADCLQAHPDVNVLASQADQQTRGAERSLQAAGKTIGLTKDDVKVVSAYGTVYGVAQVRAGKWVQTSYNRAQSIGAAATRLILLDIAGKEVPADLQFIVQDRDVDKVPNRLTKAVLDAHPEVKGQWEG